jgi:uncharacterized protein (DUF2384 family)
MTSPATLAKALFRSVEQLGLSAELPAIMQMSSADLRSLQSGASALEPTTEAWGRALKVVSLFRILVSLLGTVERARTWLDSPNDALGARPVELLRTASDAERVYRYLDAVTKHELRLPRT